MARFEATPRDTPEAQKTLSHWKTLLVRVKTADSEDWPEEPFAHYIGDTSLMRIEEYVAAGKNLQAQSHIRVKPLTRVEEPHSVVDYCTIPVLHQG